MAFNGSGVFQRLYNWVNDAAASIKIRADRMDAEMDGFATGLSTCITKDGQTTITANLPMATYRHTNVGAGAARTDYTRLDQSQDGKLAWVAAGGTSDAITANYAIPLSTLVDGQLCYVRAGAANTTTTPTFSPNGLTARTIVREGGGALAIGDIVGAGHELILRYNLANTRWEMLNPSKIPASLTLNNIQAGTSAGVVIKNDGGTTVATLGASSGTGVTLAGSLALGTALTVPNGGTGLTALEATVASASTVDLGAQVAPLVNITGTTTITSFGTVAAGTLRRVVFSGALTLTHNGTSLILPGSANITTAAGDSLVAVSLGSGNWRVVDYQLASGLALVRARPCLAAVSFDGTTGPGTIRGTAINVSSVTRNSTGDYTINFTSALADANYIVVGMAGQGASSLVWVYARSTTSVSVRTATPSTLTNINDVNIMVY